MSGSIVAKPSPVGSAIGILAGLLATAAAVGFSAPAAVSSLAGMVVLLIGIVLPRPGLITGGAVFLVAGVVLAGLSGAPGVAVGVGFVGAVVAWDVSHNSLSHGRQVGRDAPTASTEAIHAGASLLVGFVGVGMGYGIFSFAGTGQPASAVALLTIGAIALVLAVK